MMRVLAIVALLLAVANAANLTVSNVLGNNMVLQRAPASALIWGWATPNVVVSVQFDNANYEFTAEPSGYWYVGLPPTEASTTSYNIVVSSADGGKVLITNVLFGEVWVCGGQSNMQFTVSQVLNATEELADSNNYPNIRVLSVGDEHYDPTPLNQLYADQLPWAVAGEKTIGLGDWTAFSAVCWFTGKALYNTLQVPIGLISSNWGGTVIQAWSGATALQACNVTTSGTEQQANSVLYNAMIFPFHNYKIAGVLWYQGEANVGQADLYACMFPAMINDWRTLWGYTFPFLFVQLAPYTNGANSQLPDTRAAQLAALQLEKVGYATAVDLGDATSPYGNIHPRDKQDVGKRLSWAARSIAYGEDTIVWQGPVFQAASFSQSGTTVTIAVTFAVPSGSDLKVVPQAWPPANLVPVEQTSNWAYQVSNGTWVEYSHDSITVAGNTVTASLYNISLAVTGVSYAYASWPITTIFDANGLPAIPFSYVKG